MYVSRNAIAMNANEGYQGSPAAGSATPNTPSVITSAEASRLPAQGVGTYYTSVRCAE